MAIEAISEEEVKNRLSEVPGWDLHNGKLRREFIFTDFAEAFQFMSAMAVVSEKLNHHPEWSNIYKRVLIDLTTHEASGVSERDFSWAKEANEIAEK